MAGRGDRLDVIGVLAEGMRLGIARQRPPYLNRQVGRGRDERRVVGRQYNVVDPVRMCLRRGAEFRRRFRVRRRWRGFRAEVQVPGANDAIATARVAVCYPSVFGLILPCVGAAYRIELSESTARPLTPSLCPPVEFAKGRTAIQDDQYDSSHKICRSCYSLAGHVYLDNISCFGRNT